MTIKKRLFPEIESSPDSLLEETLDFLRFLKTKQEADKKDTPASLAIYAGNYSKYYQ